MPVQLIPRNYSGSEKSLQTFFADVVFYFGRVLLYDRICCLPEKIEFLAEFAKEGTEVFHAGNLCEAGLRYVSKHAMLGKSMQTRLLASCHFKSSELDLSTGASSRVAWPRVKVSVRSRSQETLQSQCFYIPVIVPGRCFQLYPQNMMKGFRWLKTLQDTRSKSFGPGEVVKKVGTGWCG